MEACFWLRPHWLSATPSSGHAVCFMAQRRHSSSWSEPSEHPELCVCAPSVKACQERWVRVGLIQRPPGGCLHCWSTAFTIEAR